VNAPIHPLPVEQFARSPELASLSILGAAITACQAALLAAHPEVAHGATQDCPRGSSALRAEAILLAGRRLELAVASYIQALGREERQARRAQARFPF
jgi:hypothetical protein